MRKPLNDLTQSVVRVGEGRGFVVETKKRLRAALSIDDHYVITAAHLEPLAREAAHV